MAIGLAIAPLLSPSAATADAATSSGETSSNSNSIAAPATAAVSHAATSPEVPLSAAAPAPVVAAETPSFASGLRVHRSRRTRHLRRRPSRRLRLRYGRPPIRRRRPPRRPRRFRPRNFTIISWRARWSNARVAPLEAKSALASFTSLDSLSLASASRHGGRLVARDALFADTDFAALVSAAKRSSSKQR